MAAPTQGIVQNALPVQKVPVRTSPDDSDCSVSESDIGIHPVDLSHMYTESDMDIERDPKPRGSKPEQPRLFPPPSQVSPSSSSSIAVTRSESLQSAEQEYLANLRELVDLHDMGEKVSWPNGINVGEARAIIDRAPAPTETRSRPELADQSLPTNPEPETAVEHPACTVVPVHAAPVAVNSAPASFPRPPARRPQTTALRSRFAFGRVSETQARYQTSRDSERRGC